MKKSSVGLLAVVILCVAGFFAWQKWSSRSPEVPPEKPAQTESSEPSAPVVKYPVNATVKGEAIPAMSESDKSLQQKAADFFGKQDFADVVIFEDFIQHFVVAMDNAMGKQIPVTLSPLKTAPGEFVVTPSGDGFILSEKNFARYQHYMDLLQGADLNKIVAYYRQIYPLFQATYRELGTQGYFNDKVIEVIDNVLETPEVAGPIHLTKPLVRYQFADPDLESLSAIQKIVVRMGPGNAKIIKVKFKELRKMLSELNS